MIFSELYSVYYNAVAKILARAVAGALDAPTLRRVVEETAFGESVLVIPEALRSRRWQLLLPDGTTPLRHAPTMPLTELEKRWLKAISLDPRVQLFDLEFEGLEEVEPLFTQEDYRIYDQYNDGDDYGDPAYIAHFRLVQDAIRRRYPLDVTMLNRHGQPISMHILPDALEYSEKDDKFRILTRDRGGAIVNLGRITACKRYEGRVREARQARDHRRELVFELTDERNALERVMLHFAHFEKQTERIDDRRYRVRLIYDYDDETELVIRVLSFGPQVRVLAPERFVELIRDRLRRQAACTL